MTGLWVAVAAIAVALLFGGFRTLTDGRFRGTRAVRALDTPAPRDARHAAGGTAAPGHAAGETASLHVPSDAGEPPSEAVAGRAASAGERIGTRPETTWTRLGDAAGSAALGERATLVQFSSAFCAPCRVTRRVLSEVADLVPGVAHVEVDAEHHLDAVRRLGIVRTPTTLVLDATGHEVARAAGAPRKEQVLAALPV